MNTYNKRLTFPQVDFSIEPDEIKIVSESEFLCLASNVYIKEVVKEEQKDRIEEDEKVGTKKRNKGRKIINK